MSEGIDINPIYSRTQLLLGAEAASSLARRRVIIFGVGGVGSWCAEALVRTGFTRLTLVDSDCVDVTNINRQLMATTATIGEVKVEALWRRLLEINPEASITALRSVYSDERAEEFGLEQYDCIVDAIDSLADKASLILRATRVKGALFVSSMGAALKLDPTRIGVAEFWKVKGDPLARALRDRFKRTKLFPARKFQCVFSDELLPNLGEPTADEARPVADAPEWHSRKKHINGSLVHITGIFGFTLAGLITSHFTNQTINNLTYDQ